MGTEWMLIIVFAVVVVVIVALLILWLLRGQNNLVHAEELCRNALSQISVQQESRWDALSILVDLAKEYSDKEYRTLTDIISARQGYGGKLSSATIESQENISRQGLSHINALAESYPNLKSNTLYLKAMDDVRNYEDKLRVSRMVYNDTVTKYNRLVLSLPGSWLAGSLGFEPYEYLKGNDAKSEMPNVTGRNM